MDEIYQPFLNAGVAGALAVTAMYWNRRDSQRQIEDEKKRTEAEKAESAAREKHQQMLLQEQRSDKIMMVDSLNKNTAAITELIGEIRNGRPK